MIKWRGSLVTPQTYCPATNDFIFAICNCNRSRSKINMIRLMSQSDSAEISTTENHTMPLLKTYRALTENVTGGIILNRRPPWDTAINDPDPGVVIRWSGGFDNPTGSDILVSGQTGPAWQNYTQRACTTAEQRRSIDNSLLSRLTSVEDFVLQPGEALVVQWVSNVPVGGVTWIGIAWEEEEVDTGYTISGTVNLDGNPVSGAKVLVVTDLDRDLPNPQLEVLTTGGPGTWSKTLPSAVKASVFVQARDGSDLYTDEGKPYIEKP
jgi:hypothetical protein